MHVPHDLAYKTQNIERSKASVGCRHRSTNTAQEILAIKTHYILNPCQQRGATKISNVLFVCLHYFLNKSIGRNPNNTWSPQPLHKISFTTIQQYWLEEHSEVNADCTEWRGLPNLEFEKIASNAN